MRRILTSSKEVVYRVIFIVFVFAIVATVVYVLCKIRKRYYYQCFIDIT